MAWDVTGMVPELEAANRSEAPVEPIARVPLHEAVVSRLRDMIIEGNLAPGTRIPEVQLGAQLGVSRTPLREAMKFLASEGLIELVPGRGALVRRFSPKDIEDMLMVLRTLEVLAVRLACVNASDSDIARVRAMHDRMLGYYEKRQRLDYYKLNQQIHTTMVSLAGNEPLAYTHGILQSRLKRIRFIGSDGPVNWGKAVAEHNEIIAAFEARDPDRLAAIIELHLRGAWERVREII
jgi:DNA-binding GntR family transcriptional regulator